MSTIVGMICFSTTVFGRFWDYSDVLQQTLALEKSFGQQPRLGMLSELDHPSIAAKPVEPKSPSIAYWQLGAVALAVTTLFSAMIMTREGRRKKKLKPAPATDITKVQKILKPKLAPGDVFSKRQLTMSILLNQLGQDGFSEMKVGHLVSSKVKTILPSMPLEEVKTAFLTHHFRHLFVCDIAGALLGIISARDLQRAATGFASDVMSTDITTSSPHQPVSPTITMMMDKRISCLPVVDDDRLLGIVTTTDLLIALQCTLQILQTLACTKASATQAV